MYRRAPTLIDHQQLACEALEFHWLSDAQRHALMRALRQELTGIGYDEVAAAASRPQHLNKRIPFKPS